MQEWNPEINKRRTGMKINEIIRTRRLEAKLTQEQVAAYLGVTAPAVNKWEKGTSFPDITLLPPLARLLRTDLNTLLSFKEDLTEQEVAHIINEISEEAVQNGFWKAWELAMEKLHEYPTNDKLLLNTAMALEGAYMVFGEIEVEMTEEYKNQIEELYIRAARSMDSSVGNQAKAMLASKYMSREEYEKAQQMLEELPDENIYDKKRLQANILIAQKQYADAARLIEGIILRETNAVHLSLVTLMELSVKEERLEDAEYIANVAKEMVSLFDLWEYSAYVSGFGLAVLKKDAEGSLEMLDKMLEALKEKWHISHSPLYRHTHTKGKADGGSIWEQMGSRILAGIENIENEEYAFLRENPGLKELVEKFE